MYKVFWSKIFFKNNIYDRTKLTLPDGKPEISSAFSTRLRSSLFCVNIFIILQKGSNMKITIFLLEITIAL